MDDLPGPASQDVLQAAIDRATTAEAAYLSFLERLRDGDPCFAEASVLCDNGMNEWQAASYMLTGCDLVWRRLGRAVMEDCTVAPIFAEIEHPAHTWSSTEHQVMV